MRLAEIYHLLQHEPLLCGNDYRETLLTLLNDHRALEKTEFKQRTGKVQKSGDELEVEQVEIRDGVCIIPVGGPLAINLGEFEKGAGAVDMDDIGGEIDEAEADDEVKSIVLNFDSPGGTYNGTFELCERILAADKPIYAFTRGTMCSGAYALALACDGIFATPSARVGNIGVYTVVNDLSRMAEMAGIKVKVISSGPIKGLLTPGTSLTPEQELFLQRDVMEKAKTFFNYVRQNRESVSIEDMGGQFYSGMPAVEHGFVDSLISGLDELLEFLQAE